MKKLLLFVLAIIFIFPLTAFADWQVTVSGWTMSTGPDLAYEEIRLNGVSQCTNILPADDKSCVFNVPNKTNQEVVIRSYDDSANFEDYIMGNVGIGPNPASGGSITIMWQ